MSDLNKVKSFWERPEGLTGMLAIGAGVLGLWFTKDFFIELFGAAITMLGQAITITILGAVLFGLIMILSNPQFQTLIGYIFKSAMRKVTGIFVEIDPIGIMKSYIRDLKDKREEMGEARDKLNGQMKITQKKIDENTKASQNAMTMAKVARDKNMQSQVTVQGRQAMRLEALNNEKLIPLLRQMELHKIMLDKYYEVTGTVIEDCINEVDAREQEREAILASYTAMKAAKRIINGGTDERELFDQAMEFVVNDYGMKMGEIDSFMESSRSFVDGLDLQNGVYEEEALRRLEEWDKKAESLLFTPATKQQLLEARSSTTLDGVFVETAATVDYSKMLNR